MKWSVLALLAVLAALPATVSAQNLITIGDRSSFLIAQNDDKSPKMWGQSEHELFTIKYTDGDMTPSMRTQMLDARTVEILTRTQAPRLGVRNDDVHVVSSNGHTYIAVRQYMLMEVKDGDARADGTSKEALASRWVSTLRNVLPQVAPKPSEVGI
jgi:hypothetical protein